MPLTAVTARPGTADRRGHLLRHPADRPRARATLSLADPLSGWEIAAFRSPSPTGQTPRSSSPGRIVDGADAEVPQGGHHRPQAVLQLHELRAAEGRCCHTCSRSCAQPALLEQQLSDGRRFVLGSEPGWADIACYFPVWMARTFVPVSGTVLDANRRMSEWEARVRAIRTREANGHRSPGGARYCAGFGGRCRASSG